MSTFQHILISPRARGWGWGVGELENGLAGKVLLGTKFFIFYMYLEVPVLPPCKVIGNFTGGGRNEISRWWEGYEYFL